MSDEKRAKLIESGQFRPDGTRIEKCPVCGQQLPEHMTTAALAAGDHAVAEAEAVAVGVATPDGSES